MNFKKFIGPGALITAAFIGPGTLTVCTLAGVKFGYELIWVLVFAVLATIVLQGMAARIGVVTGMGLGEAIRSQVTKPIIKTASLLLVFVAIIIGNAAYEMGNITGAVLGLKFTGLGGNIIGPLLVGGLAGIILWFGNIKLIQKIMGGLVVLMSLIFITSAIYVGSGSAILGGVIPNLNSTNQLTALALIGTTIVPYNLFLHASAAIGHDFDVIKKETVVTIMFGGLISICVLITAASGQGGMVQNIADMSKQLEPLLGEFAKPFLSIGIFAAGVSSALTAPLAAALTAKGIFQWENGWKEKLVWMGVLGVGVAFSMAGFKPIAVIQIAQVANGILLPVIVVFLIFICNRSTLMGEHKNSRLQNMLAFLVLIIALIVSVRSFNSVFHFIQ